MIDDIHVGIAIVVAVSNGDQIAEPARPVGKGADFFPRENLRRLVGVGGGGGDGHEGRRGSGAGGRGADPRVIVGRVGYRRRGGVVGGGSGGEDDGVSVFVEEAVGSFVVSVGRCVRWLWLFVVPLRMTFFFVSRSRGGSELPVVPSCDIRFHGRFSGIHRGQLGRQWILEQHRRELKFIRVVVVVLVFPSVRVKVHFAAAIAIRRGGRRRRSVRTSTRRTAVVVVVVLLLLFRERRSSGTSGRFRRTQKGPHPFSSDNFECHRWKIQEKIRTVHCHRSICDTQPVEESIEVSFGREQATRCFFVVQRPSPPQIQL
mmetsp:Transcript_29118/g.55120  ORF Transcript_29118/g.55120 Transcript_29118/m.55120 type:complete len:316 (+) Transcript_29118:3201-4148(+)